MPNFTDLERLVGTELANQFLGSDVVVAWNVRHDDYHQQHKTEWRVAHDMVELYRYFEMALSEVDSPQDIMITKATEYYNDLLYEEPNIMVMGEADGV